MDTSATSTSPPTKQDERIMMPPIRSLTEEINSLSLSSASATAEDPSGPPEWMLRIMRERGGQLQREDRQTKRELKKNGNKTQLVGESGEELVGNENEWKSLGGMRNGREGEGEKEKCQGETPKLGGGIGEGGSTSESRSQPQKDCTSRLLEACLSSSSDSTIVPDQQLTSTIYYPPSLPLDEEGGDSNHPLGQYSSISPSPHHHEFSSASSNSSNASNYGGGFQSYTAASSSSSGASSSGFSSAASASSITSASSTTTFSVSSHEREREKVGQSQDRSGGGGGGGGKSRPLSAGATELYQQQQQQGTPIGGGGGGGPLGLGLYRSSSTACPTLQPDDLTTPLASYAPPLPTHHPYSSSSHSPQTFSRNPSRSSSFDLLHPCESSKQIPTSHDGRNSTLHLLSPPSLEILAHSSSPTPSTSTLAPSLPFDLSPKPRSIKGKEKALPHSEEEEGEEDGSILYPPENFAIVAPGIFRSSFPRTKNFRFLKESLKLKSVLTLIQDDYPQENLDFLEQEGIQLFQFPIPGNKEPFVHIPDDKIVAAMAVLLDTRNHPLLIHCNKGKHRTGCLVGTLRRLQTWSLTAIFDEYRRYSHPKSRQMDLQFIEAFKGLDKVWDLASQNRPHLPSWACTTPYSTPQRGKAPPEAKTKERSQSRAPSGRSSPVLKSLREARNEEQEEEDKGGGS
ncbi:hypothetical protein JCM5353_007178 [Sporobolomyces roseus]